VVVAAAVFFKMAKEKKKHYRNITLQKRKYKINQKIQVKAK